MAESRALLSQEEIDALVNFLTDNKGVSMGSVLDQDSIDKIIDLVRFNNKHGVYFNSESPDLSRIREVDIIDGETGTKISKLKCVLECEMGEDGFMKLFCHDQATGKMYRITPECLEQKAYVPDGNQEWGRVITPRMFNKVANLFRVNFSDETYDTVVKNFAEVVYGDSDARVAGVYFPPED